MSVAYTPGTVPTAPYGWGHQTSVPPASPYTPQPECKLMLYIFFSYYVTKIAYTYFI